VQRTPLPLVQRKLLSLFIDSVAIRLVHLDNSLGASIICGFNPFHRLSDPRDMDIHTSAGFFCGRNDDGRLSDKRVGSSGGWGG